jgi:hypothetical protein
MAIHPYPCQGLPLHLATLILGSSCSANLPLLGLDQAPARNGVGARLDVSEEEFLVNWDLKCGDELEGAGLFGNVT